MSKPFSVAVWQWYKKSQQRSHGSLFVLVLRRSVSLTHSQTTRAGKHICPVEWLQHSWRELLSSCRNHPSSRKSTFWRPSFLDEARAGRPFSKRVFEQTVPNFLFKKYSKINPPRRSIPLPQPESVPNLSGFVIDSGCSFSRLQIRYTSGLFIPLPAVCNWPTADQLSIDVFGHDRFELFFAPRQPRHNRTDWYLESFGNRFVRKLAQVKKLHWGSVSNVDSQKSIEDTAG